MTVTSDRFVRGRAMAENSGHQQQKLIILSTLIMSHSRERCNPPLMLVPQSNVQTDHGERNGPTDLEGRTKLVTGS